MVLAFQFGTILPMPNLKEVEVPELRRSVAVFPIVGGLLGAVLLLADWGLQHILPSWPGAVLALALYTGMTGALHLDGLMDTFDALGSRKPRDAALDIMRDSRIGAMGAVSCVLILGIKLCCLASIGVGDWGFFLVVPMVSRLCMVWSMRLAPSARVGLGLGGIYAGQVPASVIAIGSLVIALLSFFLLSPAEAVTIIIAALVFTSLFTAWMKYKFGGMTGDTYGALHELAESFLWVLAVGLTNGSWQ